MEDFQAIQFLHIIEKILNIHRDYLYLSKRKRLCLIVLVLLELAISVLICIDNVDMVMKSYRTNSVLFYSTIFFQIYFMVHSNLLIIYFGPRFGYEFKKINSNLRVCHEIVKSYSLYRKFLFKLKVKSLLTILAVAATRITINISLVVYTQQFINYKKYIDIWSHILFFLLRTWSEARFVLGILMYYCLLAIISNMLRTVNALIRDSDPVSLKDNLNSFASVYRHLLQSARLLEICFGHQILFSLVLAATHFVLTVYKTLQDFISTGDILLTIQPSRWFNLVLHTSVFIIIAREGQEVPNEVLKINRSLAKIIYKAYKDPKGAYIQNLKDFHRLVSVQPLIIALLPTMPVGMYLLPAILSLTVNYIIVSLQLSHDI